MKHRPPEKEVEISVRGLRPVILSRFVSDGLAKVAEREGAGRARG